MIGYLARRTLVLVVTLVIAAFVVFALLDLLPGDPARLMLGLDATEDAVAALRAELGLDRPGAARLAAWLAGLAAGDFGPSYTYRVPVAELIGERLGVTLPLAVLAMALTVVVGLPLGVVAAARRGGLIDAAIMALSQVGLAVPNFWLAIMLVLVFGVALGWLPAGGFPGWVDPGQALAALVLPAVALALAQGAILARITRAAVLETLGESYTRTARAKGAGWARVLWRHALPNALIPVVTIAGLQLTFLVSGAIVVESVFYLPGLGRLVLQAVAQRDLVVVRGVTLLLVGGAIVITYAVDALYVVIDPRLRPAA